MRLDSKDYRIALLIDADNSPASKIEAILGELSKCLVKLLRSAVQSAANEDGRAMLGTVGNHISNQASFDPRNYGYDRLGEIFEATQLFETNRVTTVMYVQDIRFGKNKVAPSSNA